MNDEDLVKLEKLLTEVRNHSIPYEKRAEKITKFIKKLINDAKEQRV